MHRRRSSKPASENSAPPLKTRRLALLLLCTAGQALAVSSPALAHHSQSGAPASEAKSMMRLVLLPGSGTQYQLGKTTRPAARGVACPPQFVPMLLSTLMPPSQPPPSQPAVPVLPLAVSALPPSPPSLPPPKPPPATPSCDIGCAATTCGALFGMLRCSELWALGCGCAGCCEPLPPSPPFLPPPQSPPIQTPTAFILHEGVG